VRALQRWLSSPQKTDREALIVGVVGGLLTAALVYAAALLQVLDAIDFGGTVPVWVVAYAVRRLATAPEPDTFRGLVEGEIDVDEDVKSLDDRVRERRATPPPRSAQIPNDGAADTR